MKEKYTLSEDGFVGYWHPNETLHRNIISVLFKTGFSKKYGIRRMLRGCYDENVQTEG